MSTRHIATASAKSATTTLERWHAFRAEGSGTGDVDARFQSDDLQNYTDEIVVAADAYDPDSPGLSGSLGLYTLGMGDYSPMPTARSSTA